MSTGNELVTALPLWQPDYLCDVEHGWERGLGPAEASNPSPGAFVNIAHLQEITKKKERNTHERTTRFYQHDYLTTYCFRCLKSFLKHEEL